MGQCGSESEHEAQGVDHAAFAVKVCAGWPSPERHLALVERRRDPRPTSNGRPRLAHSRRLPPGRTGRDAAAAGELDDAERTRPHRAPPLGQSLRSRAASGHSPSRARAVVGRDGLVEAPARRRAPRVSPTSVHERPLLTIPPTWRPLDEHVRRSRARPPRPEPHVSASDDDAATRARARRRAPRTPAPGCWYTAGDTKGADSRDRRASGTRHRAADRERSMTMRCRRGIPHRRPRDSSGWATRHSDRRDVP